MPQAYRRMMQQYGGNSFPRLTCVLLIVYENRKL